MFGFGRLLGHSEEVNSEKMERSLAQILLEGETVTLAFKLVRDSFVFTTRRIIFINKQGVTGSKTSYHSIPYRAITQFSVESAGSFDMEAELNIWVSGQGTPYRRTLGRGSDVVGIQLALASHAC